MNLQVSLAYQSSLLIQLIGVTWSLITVRDGTLWQNHLSIISIYPNLISIKGTWYTWSPKSFIFYVLSDIIIKPWCFKNLNDTFWPRVHRWEKWSQSHLLAELKLKILNMQRVTFSISTPSPSGAFGILLHFPYLWNIAQKVSFRFFYMLGICIQNLQNRLSIMTLISNYQSEYPSIIN